MRKGILELCILSIIKQKESYPSDIIEQLKKSEMIVVEGTLYPLLSRMKNSGFLSYNWKESKSGPPRKYYQLTETGEAFLEELLTQWNNLVGAVNQTIKTKSSK